MPWGQSTSHGDFHTNKVAKILPRNFTWGNKKKSNFSDTRSKYATSSLLYLDFSQNIYHCHSDIYPKKRDDVSKQFDLL